MNDFKMKKAGMKEPVFENLRNEFAVTFYNATEAEAETDEQEEPEKDLLAFCKEPKTRAEIAEYLELTTVSYVMQNYIKPLVEKGALCMTIPNHPRSKNQKYYSRSTLEK